ncbi:hypothetical protein [Micromonospora sp. CP22]|uniref:hypothetical protein n=1 Tax=Micromonospora sp. CP22 TaxID=2580517 RepID=UPI0012BBCF86|nr:hypothetical protein [Micromonospora sp. CP22]MTK05175.1 hypothetical protein [Micromonospora sp. CP22]
MRRLLNEHLAAQDSVDDERERLTHISTVMRYPLPRPGRNQPRQGVQVRLRLDEGVADQARAVSLRLPGQYLHGHRDYQARLLTDAVMTAIARHEPITDEVLDGVMPLLRHGTALGLWRLTTAAISTRSELDVYKRADLNYSRRMARNVPGPAQRIEHVAAVLREEDVAWHAAYRSQAVQFLARKLLPPGAEAMEDILFGQDTRAWHDLLLDMTYRSEFDDPMSGFRSPGHDFEGRGGSAVWRAERRLEHHETMLWLRRSHKLGASRTRVVYPPGWSLCTPDRWRPAEFSPRRPLPPNWSSHLDAGRILDIGPAGRPLLWPTIEGPGGEIIPVPRFEIATTVARGVRLNELIEMVLVEVTDPALPDDAEAGWNSVPDTDLFPTDNIADFEPDDAADFDFDFDDDSEFDQYIDEWETRPLTMTAHRAFNLGLIDEAERDAAVDQARIATQEQMQHVIASLVDEDDQLCSDLRAAMDEPYRFAVLARRGKRHLSITTSNWTWPVTSLAAAITDDAVPVRAVEYLAQLMRLRCKRRLERSMEQAARAAFDHFGYDANSIL